MSRGRSTSSTLSRLFEIGGADLALQYQEISERMRGSAGEPESPRAEPLPRRAFFVNGTRISDEDVTAMERAWNTSLVDGRYWYDTASGAWGAEGGPCAGFIQAGINLGGRLAANASGGGTGVFVNGRELHPTDVLALTRVTTVWPGRYWMDAAGNFGWEGGPAAGNLTALMQSTASQSGGPWTASSSAGTVGGDGNGFLFFNDGKTFWST